MMTGGAPSHLSSWHAELFLRSFEVDGKLNKHDHMCWHTGLTITSSPNHTDMHVNLFLVQVPGGGFLIMAAFSFLECVQAWDAHPYLRRRARAKQPLVEDYKQKRSVLPTLRNMTLNATVLRPFTQAMASHGVIRKNIDLIKEALWTFYLQELPEEEKPNAFKLKPKVRSTAVFIQRMLTQIKRKWSRWELPRVPGIL